MNILFSHYGIYEQGGWGRTFMLARGLAKKGLKVTLFTTARQKGLGFKRIYKDGVSVLQFRDILPGKILDKGFGIISLGLRVIVALRSKFDVVHADSHRPNAYYPCYWHKRLKKSKYFIEWWDDFGTEGQYPGKSKWFKFLLGKWELKHELLSKTRADGVIVLSRLLFEKALKLGIQENRIELIHGGANVDHIRNVSAGIVKMERFNLPVTVTTFGFIGSGDADFPDLLPFMQALAQKKNDFNLKLLNFGRAFSFESKKKYDVDDLVIECGWIDYEKDSSPLLAADVFVLIKENNLANKSGWPNKMGDYLACGRPVLLNPYGELIDFITANNPGVIQVVYSSKDIAEKISAICQGEYDLQALGARNRQLAEKKLSWNARADQLSEFYKALI